MKKFPDETTIPEINVIKHFPTVPSTNTSICEIKTILLELFKQNISNNILAAKEKNDE